MPEKADGLRDIENDRHGVNITVLIPIRDFAKLKILEVSALSWQYAGWSLVYLPHFFFFFFFFFFFLVGLMSAIGPEMTGGG